MNLEDIAKLAGVSRSTVSRVVNNDPRVSARVRTRVQETIDAVGYRPNAAARALASHRSRAIGLIVPEDFADYHVDSWYAIIIQAVLAAARDAGQSLMLIMEDTFSPGAGQRVLSQFIDSHRVDGLLVLQHSYRDHLSGPLLDAGVPVVHLCESDYPETAWVDNDNRRGGIIAAEMLRAAGASRPLIVAAALEHVPTRRRLQGFHDIYPAAGMLITDHSFSTAEEMLRKEFAKSNFDAVFTINGWLAPVAHRVISEAGLRIPADICLISFDDFDTDTSRRLELTSLVQHTTQLANHAVRLLIDRVEGRAPPGECIVLDTELISRGSCGELIPISMEGGVAE